MTSSLTPMPTNQTIDRPFAQAASRRQFLGLLAAAGLLSACGDDGSPTASPSARSVDHELGTTRVTGPPERVVTTYERNDLQNLLALAITPVLTGSLVDATLPPWTVDRLGDAEVVEFVFAELPLERFAAAAPDLILGFSITEEEYDSLGEIAPTVVVSNVEDWRAQLLLVGEATFRDDRAAEVIAQTEALITQTRERLASGQLPRIAIVNPAAAETGGLWRPDTALGDLLSELGFPALVDHDPETDSVLASFNDELAAEQLDVDLLVLTDTGFNSGESLVAQSQAFLERPVVAATPVVSEGRVVQLTSDESNALLLISALSMPAALAAAERIAAGTD